MQNSKEAKNRERENRRKLYLFLACNILCVSYGKFDQS